VTSDNDFVATNPSRIYAFAIDPSRLPGFQPQAIAGEARLGLRLRNSDDHLSGGNPWQMVGSWRLAP
jgi:hypothetical protein